MLVLFTDYGWNDPYVGQLKAVLAREAPGVAIVDLIHSVPDFNAHAGGQLLDALCAAFPSGSVFVTVVDPGVGGPRDAVVAEADGRWFVGPDNGLLSIVIARASTARIWKIVWQPDNLSDTFHGRDLFAPVAALIASGRFPEDRLEVIPELTVRFDPADLPRIIYIDHYGNAWTGIRGGLMADAELEVNGIRLPYRRVFSEAGKGEAFWHMNSSGLVEVAANRANAAEKLGLNVGDLVRLSSSPEGQLH